MVFWASPIDVIPAAIASVTQSASIIELVGMTAFGSKLLPPIERVALLTHALRVVLLFRVRTQLNFPTFSMRLTHFLLHDWYLSLPMLFFYRFGHSFIKFPLYGVAVAFKIKLRSLTIFNAPLILVRNWQNF